MSEQIVKLEAEVEALHNLTMRAYVRFAVLRPMMVDEALLGRIAKEKKALGFNRLRTWLYSGLVQQLSKICSDRYSTTPSIATVTKKLENDQLRKQLEERWVRKARELYDDDEAKLRAVFNREYSDYLQRAREMLSSHSVDGFKTARDRLISHYELRQSKQSPTGTRA